MEGQGDAAATPPAAPWWTPGSHLLDPALGLLRQSITLRFVSSSVRLFTLIGLWSLAVSAPTVLLLFLLITARSEGLSILGVSWDRLSLASVGVGVAMLLGVLQYAAFRLLPEVERLNEATSGSMSSLALPDSVALAGIAVGFVLLLALSELAIQVEYYWSICTALQAFILWEFFGFVALQPASISISVEPVRRPAEESIGVLGFLVKTALRTTPVAFGTGVALQLMYVVCGILLTLTEPAETFPACVPQFVLAPTLGLLAYGALPVAAYFIFLVYYLAVSLLLAVLSVPRKLDRLTERTLEGDSR